MSPWCLIILSMFYMLICHLYILFSETDVCECVFVVVPFSNWIVWICFCWIFSSLYILDTSPVLDMWFANIFSKVLILMRFSLSCFPFTDCTHHVNSKNFLPNPKFQFQRFLKFFPKSFIVSPFTFNSVPHFGTHFL